MCCSVTAVGRQGLRERAQARDPTSGEWRDGGVDPPFAHLRFLFFFFSLSISPFLPHHQPWRSKRRAPLPSRYAGVRSGEWTGGGVGVAQKRRDPFYVFSVVGVFSVASGECVPAPPPPATPPPAPAPTRPAVCTGMAASWLATQPSISHRHRRASALAHASVRVFVGIGRWGRGARGRAGAPAPCEKSGDGSGPAEGWWTRNPPIGHCAGGWLDTRPCRPGA